MAPVWEQLGEAFAQDDSVVIAKIDLTSNDAADMKVSGYPTLKMIKKDTNEVVSYSGGRDLDSLVHFVKTGEVLVKEEVTEEPVKEQKDEL